MFIKSKDSSFIPSYLHILYESPLCQCDSSLYHKLLEQSVKISSEGNLILESTEMLIDVPRSFIDFMIENERTPIPASILKTYLKESKHWRNIRNKKIDDTLFFMFDFSNEREIDKFHYIAFGFGPEDLKNARLDFIEMISQRNLGGFFGNFYARNVICANTSTVDLENVIYHEFSHFIQFITGIRVVKPPEFTNVQKNNISKLFSTGLSQVISYFSAEEFIPHVDELSSKMLQLKEKYYKELENDEFLKVIMNFLKRPNTDEIATSSIFIQWQQMFNGDVDCLAMLLASFKTHYKFQVIWNFLKKGLFYIKKE